jgi:TRAP-type mannitol/chloroaromatic compound transport system substrate-binding protein
MKRRIVLQAGLQELREKKVNLNRTPDEVMRKQLETWDKIREENAAKDPFFKKVMESQKAYAQLVVNGRQTMFLSYDFAANYYWKKR